MPTTAPRATWRSCWPPRRPTPPPSAPQHDLGAAYLRKAREAALAKNAAEEDRWLNEARAAGMKPADILAFQRDLTNARARRPRRPRASARCSSRATASATAASPIRRRTAPPSTSTQLQASDPTNAAPRRGRPRARGQAARARARRGRRRQAGRCGPRPGQALGRRPEGPRRRAAAAERAEDAAALDPATLAASLKRLRSPPPDYPENALNAAHRRQRDAAVHGRRQRRDPRHPRDRGQRRPECSTAPRSTPSGAGAMRRRIVNGTRRARSRCKTLVRFELPK